MQTKHLIAWVLLLMVMPIQAQVVKVISDEPLNLPESELGYNPVISPTGTYILFSGDDFSGLRRYDLKTERLVTLSTEKGAGFDLKISEDGKLVAYRSQEYSNKLRYTTLKVIDMQTRKKHNIIKKSRDIEGYAFEGGSIFVIEDGKMRHKRIIGDIVLKRPAVSSIQKGQLQVTRYSQTSTISPTGSDDNYLWTSVSPDGTKLLYYVIEHGQAYVSNLDGSNPVSLGVLRAPKWMGSDWVVGMEDYDNGVRLTASSVVIVSAEGENRTVLTPSSVIATNPSGTKDASTIVYNTDDGQVRLLKLSIAK